MVKLSGVVLSAEALHREGVVDVSGAARQASSHTELRCGRGAGAGAAAAAAVRGGPRQPAAVAYLSGSCR
jgi:hypothetical protein